MFLGSIRSNSGIPRLDNYEQALAHFNSIQPIRGCEGECRPIGNRDRPHFSIQLNDQQEVECCYRDSPIITFRSNGEVLLNPSELRERSFIEEVMGIKSRQIDYQIHFFLFGGVFVESSNAGRLTGLVIKRDPKKDNNYHPIGHTPSVVHYIRRREANKIRAQYLDIVEYAEEYFRLGTPMPSKEQMKEMFGFDKMKYLHRPTKEINIFEMQFTEFVVFARKYFYANTSMPSEEDLKKTFELEKAKHQNRPVRPPETWREYDLVLVPKWNYANPDDINVFISWMRSDEPHDRHKAMVVLCHRTIDRGGNERHHEVMLKIDRMILARHKHEVFKEVQVPEGVVKKDKYSWAF